MLSKEERSQLNHEFWGEFKKLMRGHSSSLNTKVNWLHYPTHLKHTYLKLIFDNSEASLCFDVQFRDDEIRALFWDQLLELKTLLEKSMQFKTQWLEHYETKEGLIISRLKWETNEFLITNKKDWKKAQHFFKSRLLEFDLFYQEYKDVLINLIK